MSPLEALVAAKRLIESPAKWGRGSAVERKGDGTLCAAQAVCAAQGLDYKSISLQRLAMEKPMVRQGEPTFELRAQDRFMPEILEEWASRVERAVNGTVTAEADKSRDKAKKARALAYTVRAWQVMNFAKIPD